MRRTQVLICGLFIFSLGCDVSSTESRLPPTRSDTQGVPGGLSNGEAIGTEVVAGGLPSTTAPSGGQQAIDNGKQGGTEVAQQSNGQTAGRAVDGEGQAGQPFQSGEAAVPMTERGGESTNSRAGVAAPAGGMTAGGVINNPAGGAGLSGGRPLGGRPLDQSMPSGGLLSGDGSGGQADGGEDSGGVPIEQSPVAGGEQGAAIESEPGGTTGGAVIAMPVVGEQNGGDAAGIDVAGQHDFVGDESGGTIGGISANLGGRSSPLSCENQADGTVVMTSDYDGECTYVNECAATGSQTRLIHVCAGGHAQPVIDMVDLEVCDRPVEGMRCGDDGQRCQAGQCVFTCGNGDVDADLGETCDDGNADPFDGCHDCRLLSANRCDDRICDPRGTWMNERTASLEIPEPIGQTLTVTTLSARLAAQPPRLDMGEPPAQVPIQPLFGEAVAIDGDWALVGASDGIASAEMGDVYFFQRRDSAWHVHTRMSVDPGRVACRNECPSICAFCEEHEQMCRDNNLSPEECAFLGSDACLDPDLPAQCARPCFDPNGIGWCAESHRIGAKLALAGDHAVIWSAHWYTSEFEIEYDPVFYVYQRIEDAWTPVASLRPDGFMAEFSWGDALAMSERTILTGSIEFANEAFVFELIDGRWQQRQRLVPPVMNEGLGFGRAVDVSTDHLIIGAPFSQAAYVFVSTVGGWTIAQRLSPNELWEDERFGSVVAIDGATAVVGDRHAGRTTAIFSLDGGQWTQTQLLPYSGSVTLAGDMLVVASRWWYGRENGIWTLRAELPARDGEVTSQLDGHTLIVGTPQADVEGGRSGSAFIVERPAPLCHDDGACACRPNASGLLCNESRD